MGRSRASSGLAKRSGEPPSALQVLRDRRDAAHDALLRGRLARHAERLAACLPLAAALPPQDSLAHADVLLQALIRPAGAVCAALPSQAALWRDCAALLRARHAAGTLLAYSPGEAAFIKCRPLTLLLMVAVMGMRWARPAPALDAEATALSLGNLPVPDAGADAAELAALAIAVCAAELTHPGAPPLAGDADAMFHARMLVACVCAALDVTQQATPWAHADTFLFAQPHVVENTHAISRYVNAHEAEMSAALDSLGARSAHLAAARRRAVDRAAAAEADGAPSPAAAPAGLRRCALPSCGATECEPKQFRHCAGCGDAAAAYCCSGHQRDDWKRHKRACRHAAASREADVAAAARARFEELRTDVGFCRSAHAVTINLSGPSEPEVSFCLGLLACLPNPDGPEGMDAPPPPFPADAPPFLRDTVPITLVNAHEELMRSLRRMQRAEELDRAAAA